MATWLGIGARIEHGDGIRLDIRPVGDVQGDILALPLRDGCVAGIECHHVLEHIERDEAERALRELYRALGPEGTLEISVPDMLKCAAALLDGKIELMVNIYSPDAERAQQHKWGYTPGMLLQALDAAGFGEFRTLPDRDRNSVRYQCFKRGGE